MHETLVKMKLKRMERKTKNRHTTQQHTVHTFRSQLEGKVLKNTSDKLCNNDILILLKKRKATATRWVKNDVERQSERSAGTCSVCVRKHTIATSK